MNKSVIAIRKEFQEANVNSLKLLIEQYAGDSRSGVLAIIEQAKKKLSKLEIEKRRIDDMKAYEKEYNQYTYICGVDEVGRGPVAGPIVAGAVILPSDCDILYLNDSKKLSQKKREELFDEIMEKAIATGIGVVSFKVIDEKGISYANHEAMRLAITDMQITPEILFVDAVKIPEVLIPQVSIVKGDAKSVSIAAASIIAKVTRDRMMEEYDNAYPEYGFASNKGYESASHAQALREIGPCPIHRRSFIKKYL